MERWLARVWPAIALGGVIGGEGMVDLLQPMVAGVSRLFAAAEASVGPPTGAATPAALPTPIGSPATPDVSRPILSDASVAVDREEAIAIVTLAVSVGLLVLLVFTFWKEMSAALRAGLR